MLHVHVFSFLFAFQEAEATHMYLEEFIVPFVTLPTLGKQFVSSDIMRTFLQLFKIYLFVVCCINWWINVCTCVYTFAYVCRDQGRYWLPFLDLFILFPPDQISVESGEPCFLVRLEVTKCQGMSCLCILSTGIIGVYHCA